MEMFAREYGKRIKNMEKLFLHIKMGVLGKEHSRMDVKKEQELSNSKVAKSSKANGRMEKK